MPPKPTRSVSKRAEKRTKPYPASQPLGTSNRANHKPSPAPPLLTPPNPERAVQKKPSDRGERKSPKDLGVPSREEYAVVEAEYLGSLDHRKKTKALISRDMFNNIWLALHFPDDHTIESAQFRWWVRKMFKLKTRDGSPLPAELDFFEEEQESPYVVIHDGKRVAVKDQLYDILSFCHTRIDHGGRDRTAAEIRKRYTWVPKELIAGFVRACPTCVCKRTGKYDEGRVVKAEQPTSELEARLADEYGRDGDAESAESAQDLPEGPSNTTNLPELPPRDLLGLRMVPAHDYSGAGLPHPVPALLPWYMSSAGPSQTAYGSTGSRSLCGSFSGNSPVLPSAWPQPLFDLPFQPRRTACDEHVRLPSIHTCGKVVHNPAEYPKVVLPSLAHIFAPKPPIMDPLLARHPLGAIPGNAFAQPHSIPGGFPYYCKQEDVSYIPQIDPALLQPDGVHMLALAAETAQARELRGRQ